MIKGGYRGKILRVDLTKGAISTENLPDESVLRKYVGNFGLGMWYLMRELPEGTEPLDPENPLIFLNGPLVGTGVPSQQLHHHHVERGYRLHGRKVPHPRLVRSFPGHGRVRWHHRYGCIG